MLKIILFILILTVTVVYIGLKMYLKLVMCLETFQNQSCGSAFIFCGSGIFSQCGSGSSCILNADPDPALQNLKKLPFEEFSFVEENMKRFLKSTVNIQGACADLLQKFE